MTDIKQILNFEYSTTVTLFGTLTVVASTYVFLKWLKTINYFKKLNIPGPTPLPLLGNLYSVIKLGVNKSDMQLVNQYGRTVGYFEGGFPVILTTDLELIKSVLIKDFNYFVNRRTFDSLSTEPFDKFLTILKDDSWKNVRAIVTTTFTTSKLKSMSKVMIDCADNILKHIEKLEAQNKLLDSKEVFGCYTTDVISSCCFGVSTDSINDPDSKFIKYLKQIFSQNISASPKLLLLFFAPSLSGYLAKKKIISFFPDEAIEFFKQVSEQIIEKRKLKEEVRDDFIQIMIDHEETKIDENDEVTNQVEQQQSENTTETHKLNWKNLKKTLSDGEILAQALGFFIAGYETTATTLNFVTYHLAIYPECQKKLYEDLKQAIPNKDDIKYEMLNEVHYLDMVINETLRLYPPAVRLDRVCNKDYKYNDLIFPKGSVIGVPIWALHHDPEIYPEPEKFIPERFEEKSHDNIAFMPFGAGPRNCVGLRFAMLEMKILLAKIVLSYEILPTNETPIPLVLQKNSLLLPMKPIMLKLKKRTE